MYYYSMVASRYPARQDNTMNFVCLCIFIALSLSDASAISYEDYYTERDRLINKSESLSVGGKLLLNDNEEKLNEILLNWKYVEFDDGLKDPLSFLGSQHFFKSRENIEKSQIFQFIKKLPKGASLHSHDLALVSNDYVYNLTFRDNLYSNIDSEGRIDLKFFKKPPGNPWKSVEELRKNNQNFDNEIKKQITLETSDPQNAYPDENAIWKKFEDLFGTINQLITYKPAFEDYFYQALRELHEDNVRYIEFRGQLPEVYDLDGRVYGPTEVMDIYYQTWKKFHLDFPDFLGAKFIYGPSRKVSVDTIENYKRILDKINNLYPDFIAGFDLVGQEDKGRPLVDFIPQLLKLKEEGTKFFFHAGETNWFGESSDLNLFDAVLLNTTRIGHGYAVIKHPEVQRLIKEKDIAIEIAPISNQVLKLVDDLRNHPGNFLIANGFPVVITCDDPSFWGAKGISYDWYMAFMALASKQSDLRLLKQLAINSIKYSAMDDQQKRYAMEAWQKDWDKFINHMLNDEFFCRGPN